MLRRVLPLAAVLALAGCASSGVPSPAVEPEPAPVEAAPIVGYASAVDPSDWAAIEEIAAEAFAGGADVSWYNPLTGTGGTLSPLAIPAAGGAGCRSFAVTMSDWSGVRRYRGEACRNEAGEWRIVAASPEDSEVL
ncbi:MAG: hypothetical protein KIS96_04165 [Bauldia sp.]|nr:hypothetical protein [Bauldia sp.]